MDREIALFKEKYWNKIKKKKNVQGFSGIIWEREKEGKLVPGTRVIRIYVTKKEPLHLLSKKDIIPRTLSLGNEVIETDIVVKPKMKFMNTLILTSPSDHRKKYRPYMGGISCTSIKSSACTLSWYAKKLVRKTIGNHPVYQVYIMLNQHCGGRENKAKKGEAWVQPSPYDGGTKEDIIALYDFGIPTKFSHYTSPIKELLFKLKRLLFFFKREENINYVDVSFGIPLSLNDISYRIFGIEGRIVGKGEHKIGTKIIKSGRTTGVTTGYIEDPSWNGYIHGSQGVAYYEELVLCKAKCLPGDSGSPVLSRDKLGDLLFNGILLAGSNENDMLYCKWELIERIGKVEIVTY